MDTPEGQLLDQDIKNETPKAEESKILKFAKENPHKVLEAMVPLNIKEQEYIENVKKEFGVAKAISHLLKEFDPREHPEMVAVLTAAGLGALSFITKSPIPPELAGRLSSMLGLSTVGYSVAERLIPEDKKTLKVAGKVVGAAAGAVAGLAIPEGLHSLNAPDHLAPVVGMVDDVAGLGAAGVKVAGAALKERGGTPKVKEAVTPQMDLAKKAA